MERVFVLEPFNMTPFIAKVKRRIKVDRFVMQFGLGLNILVISIVLYAELFLR